jgi:L-seryl-tRNA(Ser) seleniumtransferase
MASLPHDLRRRIPSVERLLQTPRARDLLGRYSRSFVLAEVRAVLDEFRQAPESVAPAPLPGDGAREEAFAAAPGGAATTHAGEEGLRDDILDRVEARIRHARAPQLRRVVNATGVVLHTNLGRALLAPEAIARAAEAAGNAVTLEYSLARGARGDRDELIEADLVALTGAEAATVVNNNAAAVLLALNGLAEGREVIVSRGELIEIGGSFRIPEIMAKSGARLREVGTTNRTHAEDYRAAIGPEAGLLLKVHTSNYRIVGFASSVTIDELVAIGRPYGLPVMEDLGSGALVDLTAYGLPAEPVVGDRIASGADVVTFSGDKLLGGPQAGIIVGKRAIIERLRRNPLRRATRPGKLELAALEGTLRLYRESPDLTAALPTLRWLTRPVADMDAIGRAAVPLLAARLGSGFKIELVDSESEVGSGALPEARLPTRALAISHPEQSADDIARRFRAAVPPVIGRVSGGVFLLDLRGIFASEELAVRFP